MKREASPCYLDKFTVNYRAGPDTRKDRVWIMLYFRSMTERRPFEMPFTASFPRKGRRYSKRGDMVRYGW